MDNYGTGLATPVDPSLLYETEEERRKRLEKERQQTVSTQTVETAADGTQTVTSKQQIPAQPSTDTYGRMIGVESGGRDYAPSGQPLTSPAGAMFKAQVMPATAAQPGYGIRPAASQTPEEYNRVGQEYYQAMLKQFGGDEQKAAAAYNAGPGRIQQAQQQAAQRGGSWTDYIPKETQGYLQKVFKGVGNAVEGMIPSAQAGTLPQQGAGAGRGTMGMPQAVPGEGVAVATGQGVQGTMTTPVDPDSLIAQQQQMQAKQPQAMLAPDASPTTGYINRYQQDQNDPLKLLALRNDENAPKFIRDRAGRQAFNLMDMEIKKKEAEEQLKAMAPAVLSGDRKATNMLTKELQKEEGSWLKFLFLGFINKELAGQELVKLGFGNFDAPIRTEDNKSALITYNAMGKPLRGQWADGKIMSDEEVLNAVVSGGKKDLDIVGGTFVNDQTGEVGRMVTDKRTGKTQVQTDSGLKPMTGFRPQSSSGTLSDMYARRQQELLQKLSMVGPEKVAAIVAEDEAVNGPLDPKTKQAILQRSTQAAPNMGAIPGATATQAPAAGQVAGAVPPPTSTTTTAGAGGTETRQIPQTVAPPAAQQPPGTSIADRRAAAAASAAGATTAAKVTMDSAAAEVAKSPDTANLIRSIDKSVKIIDSGKHNIGSVLSGVTGRGPVAQAIGSQFETTDAKNTKMVMDLVQKLAADGLKSLGSNPSTVDLEFWTKFKPDASSDPAFVKEWIDSRSADLQRRVNYNRQQLGLEPVFGKDMDREAYEWAKKNPNDSRAAAIKQRLGLQ